MVRVFHTPLEMQGASEEARNAGMRVGVVPTMGYLHEGHLSLIRAAQHRADFIVTTIFVNPVQFGPAEDFKRYPRNIARDTSLATEAGTTCLFIPEVKDIYPDGYSTYVQVDRLGEVLEGRSRPGHFRGVATIVTKLLNITKPHLAVFGQKDAQQAVIIRRLIEDLNLDVEVLVMPTVREPDGLAMSSRNTYLTPAQRTDATVLYQSLLLAKRLIAGGERSSARVMAAMQGCIAGQASGVPDYISIADGGTLEELPECTPGRPLLISLAVRFGTTRLIDNILINH